MPFSFELLPPKYFFESFTTSGIWSATTPGVALTRASLPSKVRARHKPGTGATIETTSRGLVPAARRGIRAEHRRGDLGAVEIPPLVTRFVRQVTGFIRVGGQIVVDRRAAVIRLRLLRVVIGDGGGAPQLAPGIVVVGSEGQPGVFVVVEDATLVDVSNAALEVALQHPDAMHFIAQVFWVHVVRLDQVL